MRLFPVLMSVPARLKTFLMRYIYVFCEMLKRGITVEKDKWLANAGRKPLVI